MFGLDSVNLLFYLLYLLDNFLNLVHFLIVFLTDPCWWTIPLLCWWRQCWFYCSSSLHILLGIRAAIIWLAVWTIAVLAVGSISGMRPFGGIEILHFKPFFARFGPKLTESIVSPRLRKLPKFIAQNGSASEHDVFPFPDSFIQKLNTWVYDFRMVLQQVFVHFYEALFDFNVSALDFRNLFSFLFRYCFLVLKLSL